MPHVVTAESEYGKELIKWEQHDTKRISGDWTPGNPYKFRPYPKMLYRAAKRQDGSVGCMDGVPHPLSFPNAEAHDRAAQAVEHFNRGCYMVVETEEAEARAKADGWRNTVPEALAHAHKRDTDDLKAAAHRAYEDRNMSPAAQAEAAQAEAEAGIKQLGEIPRQPVRRRSQASIDKAKATRAANLAKSA